MALAGPGANLVLGLITFAMMRAGYMVGIFTAPDSVRFGEVAVATAGGVWPGIASVVGVFFSMNLVLAALNLIPVPPLDGSAAVPLLLPAAAATRYQQLLFGNPALSLVGMVVAWQLFGTVFRPIFLLAVNLLYPGASYG
jgi:Zn-dependent protease